MCTSKPNASLTYVVYSLNIFHIISYTQIMSLSYCKKTYLVGGWTNPFPKKISQIGSFPPPGIGGEHKKNIWVATTQIPSNKKKTILSSTSTPWDHIWPWVIWLGYTSSSAPGQAASPCVIAVPYIASWGMICMVYIWYIYGIYIYTYMNGWFLWGFRLGKYTSPMDLMGSYGIPHRKFTLSES